MASSPKQPKPVDPNVAAEAQARWNRTGQVTPFGSVTWEGNNQVVSPSDAMMALFGQAQGIASGGGQRYEKPQGFDAIRDSVMGRLSANTYQPGSRNESKPGIEQGLYAKGTPIRDAFLGEKDPNTGDRRVIRHILRGGLMGSIPRAIGNLIDERRGNQMPGPVGLGAPGNAPIGSSSTELGPLLSAPVRQRGMPGPVQLDPIAPSPIQRNDAGESKPPATLTQTRGLGRKPTARERAAMRKDPRSILGRGGQNMQALFNSPNAALFSQYDLQASPGQAFDATVEAYRRAMQPNRNFTS